MNILLSPPLAFLIYLPLVFAIYFLGKGLAGKAAPSEEKSSLYGSGEEAATSMASPGYKPFFLIAFFFAVLHLGMLVIGSGSFSVSMLPYIIGLMMALIALILG
jgi:NADH:ubiquinone oxidoreductase subunit 3 (subunit A)